MSTKMAVNLMALVFALVISRLECLSLDQIHSSSHTFKSLSHNRNEKSSVESIANRRPHYGYDWDRLPVMSPDFYKKLMMSKKSNYEPVDSILVYNPNDSENSDESEDNQKLSTELGLRLAEILGSESDVGHKVYDRIIKKRKRSASYRNYYTQTNEIRDKKAKNRKSVARNAHNVGSGRDNTIGHNRRVKYENKQRIPIKSVTKRKSGRRVLNDHFNVDENSNSITKSNYLRAKPLSDIRLEQKPKLNKNIENKLKKSIKKRREVKAEMEVNGEPSLASDLNRTSEMQNGLRTTDKIVANELKDILSDDNSSDKNPKPKTAKTFDLKDIRNKRNSKESREIMEPIKDLQTGFLVKRKAKRNGDSADTLPLESMSDGDSDLAIIQQREDRTVDNEDSDANKWRKKQNTDEWIRKEFYENIAKTLATMRKKRSYDNQEFDDIEDSVADSDQLIAIDESGEDKDGFNPNPTQVGRRTTDDSDDYVIAAIDDDKYPQSPNIVNDDNDNTQEGDEDNDGFDWQELEEKSKLKIKRSADSYFGDLEAGEETNDINIDSDRFTRINTKLESIEDSLINEAMDLIRETAAKGSQSEAQNSRRIANRLDAAYDIEDMRTALEDLGNAFHRISTENKGNDNELTQRTNDQLRVRPAVSDFEALDHNIGKRLDLFEDNSIESEPESESETESESDSDSESESGSECSAVELLSSDCSSVADLVPTSRVRYAFVESCNWHKICYTCGEIYGLMANDCDAGFLEASRLSCGDSPSCEAFARLVLVPLRQSRVFYKTSIPKTCYQYRCIKDFLFNSNH